MKKQIALEIAKLGGNASYSGKKGIMYVSSDKLLISEVIRKAILSDHHYLPFKVEITGKVIGWHVVSVFNENEFPAAAQIIADSENITMKEWLKRNKWDKNTGQQIWRKVPVREPNKII